MLNPLWFLLTFKARSSSEAHNPAQFITPLMFLPADAQLDTIFHASAVRKHLTGFSKKKKKSQKTTSAYHKMVLHGPIMQRKWNKLSSFMQRVRFSIFPWHTHARRNCQQLLQHLGFGDTDSCNVECLLSNDRVFAVKLSEAPLFGLYLSHCFKNMLPGQIRNSL